ncbi:PhiH1 repressor-like protein [Halorubrum aidingense JCM 13560]|uniref:PhiH1 repressor-like protein n=2 Tax=Halorubrum aidingense TaxID=368623 RepID=M0PC52_9EURY|nr:PhiH1 repressor-like protein [Halorubrum aidingense JCM 13560]
MRKSSGWMTIWDDRIMEIIREGGPTSASELAKHNYIHTSRPNISRRLNKLADHGLLQRLPNGVYSLSQKGELYLDGELNAEELADQPQNGNGSAHAGT